MLTPHSAAFVLSPPMASSIRQPGSRISSRLRDPAVLGRLQCRQAWPAAAWNMQAARESAAHADKSLKARRDLLITGV